MTIKFGDFTPEQEERIKTYRATHKDYVRQGDASMSGTGGQEIMLGTKDMCNMRGFTDEELDRLITQIDWDAHTKMNQDEWKRYQYSKERHKEYGRMNRTEYDKRIAQAQKDVKAAERWNIVYIMVYVVIGLGALALVFKAFGIF